MSGAVGWNWQTQLQDTLPPRLSDQRSFGQLAAARPDARNDRDPVWRQQQLVRRVGFWQ